jgi:hypothetical protein
MKTHFAILLALALLAGACRPTPGPGATAEPYPVATSAAASAVPVSVAPTPSAPDKATITGRLLINPDNPRPVAGALLYLAEIIREASGTPYLAGFERVNSPRTLTDAAGQFAFVDVAPEHYSLVLDRVREAFLLGNPDESPGDFIFEAKAGEVLDLGELIYRTLPDEELAP